MVGLGSFFAGQVTADLTFLSLRNLSRTPIFTYLPSAILCHLRKRFVDSAQRERAGGRQDFVYCLAPISLLSLSAQFHWFCNITTFHTQSEAWEKKFQSGENNIYISIYSFIFPQNVRCDLVQRVLGYAIL